MAQEIPEQYIVQPPEELTRRIADRKKQLGEKVFILGHHYQADEVLQFADAVGDSLKLARQAADQQAAEFIVFCGVHFMAESADILTPPEVTVCLPNTRAGCAMADMADEDAVAAAIAEINEMLPGRRVLPITYVNSTAASKAHTARAGGACCTSSNVRRVFEWARDPAGGDAHKIFAIPDQHLGRNTAVELGYGEQDCVLYDPALPHGGLDEDRLGRATFILWKGHCYVHQVFTPEQVARVREFYPGIRVMVHPECPRETVASADASGSTEQIIRAVADSPEGSAWAIGTEVHLVNRLARRYPNKTIRVLSDRQPLCVQMAQIDLPHLLWTLDGLAEGRPVNPIRVPEEIAADARTALQRMLDIPAT
jgi:quinolinate synthase